MDTAARQAEPAPSNVLPLTGTIMRDGPAASTELERKRAIIFRAFELTATQLENDAEKIETNAIIGEHPIKRRYEMLHTSESLRVAASWLRGALLPQPTPDTAQPKE